MADALDVRVAITEARLDQMTSLILRCCSRCGVMPASDFEETTTGRIEALEAARPPNPLQFLKPPKP